MIDVLFISVKQPFYFYYNYYFFIFVIFFKISYCQSLAADHPEYLTEAMCMQACTHNVHGLFLSDYADWDAELEYN